MLKIEFHKHNSEWKKPDTEYILYDSISMKFTKKKNEKILEVNVVLVIL